MSQIRIVCEQSYNKIEGFLTHDVSNQIFKINKRWVGEGNINLRLSYYFSSRTGIKFTKVIMLVSWRYCWGLLVGLF